MTAAHRRRTPGAAGRLVVVALLAVACGSPIDPITTIAPSSVRPSIAARPSLAPFAKSAWPPTGDAPCGEAAPPDPAHAAYSGNLKRISAPDPTTVVFKLCSPDVAFLAQIAQPGFSINDSGWLKTHVTTAAGGPAQIVTQMNGTGSYRLESWDRGSEVSLARNEAYWGAPAKNERVIVRWLADSSQQVRELQDGTVDGVADIAPNDMQTVTDDVGLTLAPRSGLNIAYLGFTTGVPPFNNEKVRQAVAIGLDRQRIVDAGFPAGSLLASHYTPCAVPHGCAGAGWYDSDPTLAREMLTAAGFPNGLDTTIEYDATPRPSLPDPAAVAGELQTQLLANLGIRATLTIAPPETFLADAEAGGLAGIHILERTAAIPDTTAFLDPRFGPGAPPEFGAPFTDIGKALASGRSTADPDKREVAYGKANAAIRTHVPLIPFAYSGSAAAFRADVVGAGASALGLERFALMTPGDRRQFVWSTTSEPPGLYCADETDPVAELVCAQVMDTLYAFDPTGATPLPSLARGCEPDPSLTVWTCTLRPGVRFGDGSGLDASDVVLSFAVQWDAEHPLHRGDSGSFSTFTSTFGGFLHPPVAPGG